MGGEDNITGSINNAVVGIGGDIINQLCDVLICALCGSCLLQANFTKVHKEFVVDCTCIVQETSKTFLDAFDASCGQGWNGFRFSCILGLGTISYFNMAMR